MNAPVQLGHSPLGASGASRWTKCPGSVSLSRGIEDDEDDTFSAPGQAAHSLGEICLKTGQDAWEYVGKPMAHAKGMIDVDVEMANAVQTYLDSIRTLHPDRNQGNFWIERQFHCPTIHPLFYGTADAIYLDEAEKTLHVHDYKHGAGIIVEVPNNVQTMYYACGALEDLKMWDAVDMVVLHISQPRGFHWQGPNRDWSISADDLEDWCNKTLIPAMNKAEGSRETASGEHCRFCPVRAHACPQIVEDFDALEDMMDLINKKGGADKLSNAQLARFRDLTTVAKIADKAAERTMYARINGGEKIPGYKLVKARSNRDWKPGAEGAIKKKFKGDAYTEPKLKSPAQIDELPQGEAMTARWAFKPDAGMTVVKGDDARPTVDSTVKSMFKPVKKGAK